MAPGRLMSYVGGKEDAGQTRSWAPGFIKTESKEADIVRDLAQLKQDDSSQAGGAFDTDYEEDSVSTSSYLPPHRLQRRISVPDGAGHDSYPPTTSGAPSSTTSSTALRPHNSTRSASRHSFNPTPPAVVPFAHQHQRALVRDRHDREAMPPQDMPQSQSFSHHTSMPSPPSPKGQIMYNEANAWTFDLDYDHAELSQKTYEELQDESFDFDPQARPLGVDDGDNHSGLTLEERLESARKMPDEQQSALIQALSITEWEEAGQWFMDQFAVLNTRSIQCRQEMRALAQSQEAVVARRFSAVEEEDNQLRRTIDNMEASGRAFIAAATHKRKR